ncbi:hypothetical protein K1719_044009 [Acacia pycnantha]|nr:hypothetical protein K1719_044009 [Acacia pycnantha]
MSCSEEKGRIYINYPELVKAIGNSSRPFWQGFYSFQEARNRATKILPPPIFVEGKSIAELPPQIELNNERKENQSMREHFRRLNLKSQDLGYCIIICITAGNTDPIIGYRYPA